MKKDKWTGCHLLGGEKMNFYLEKVSRRHFLTSAMAGSIGALTLPGARAQRPQRTLSTALPAPEESGIDHVVLVMMENRSFDHFLGWLPTANGRQAGINYPDFTGTLHPTHHLTDYQGCAFQDPDHSYEGGRIEYDNGKCDGWLQASDIFSIGYYQKNDLTFFGSAAPGWTVCDNYFAAIMAETYPNRFYQHAAQTDRIHNSTTQSVLPTIWDRLQAASLTGKYYFNDVPFTALWGTKYLSISRPFAEFLSDCATGNLPEVSFVDPRFEDETSGTSDDDHPHADIRNGEALLNEVYSAVTTGPEWSHTLLFVNFDEWGGFFDHVPPPTGPIPDADRIAGNQDGLLGFRTPALLVSPWSRRGYVSHVQFDHTSALKLIEWRWNLAPLTVRDASANNLASALDFERPSYTAPLYGVPTGPFTGVCPQAVPTDEQSEWAALVPIAQQLGFRLP
jgi:phospholipase C